MEMVLSLVLPPLYRAEQHGEDMLAFVSQALRTAFHDALQVAMVLEGVVSLCLHEVVDVVTLWGVLEKGQLSSDRRYAELCKKNLSHTVYCQTSSDCWALFTLCHGS